MLTITDLNQIRGNSVQIYSIKTLLSSNNFPKFSILSGREGVGKSSIANLIAKHINESEAEPISFNMGLDIDMEEIRKQVFMMSPIHPKAFIFEEIHALDKNKQTALLNMLDVQPSNIYVIATTTSIYKLNRPIRSRATIWDFKALDKQQLSHLLDDYLKSINKNLTQPTKDLIVRASAGIPRDLIKYCDFISSGEYSTEQVSSLLGQISDDILFALFISLTSSDASAPQTLIKLSEQVGHDKLYQIRDYWTRFALENLIGSFNTIDKVQGNTLKAVYSTNKIDMVTKTLIRMTEDTLILELLSLHMHLTASTPNSILGKQVHQANVNSTATITKRNNEMVTKTGNSQKLTNTDLRKLSLDD